jgi:hypothetical protein
MQTLFLSDREGKVPEKKNKPTPVWVIVVVVLATPIILALKRYALSGENLETIMARYGLFYALYLVIGLGVIIWSIFFRKRV